MKPTNENLTQFSLRLAPDLYQGLVGLAKSNRKMADAVRVAIKREIAMREKYGEDYHVVTSLVERLPADTVITTLIGASK